MSLVDRYRGGADRAWLAAIVATESGGRMVEGDAQLGEYGFFQVAEYIEDEFGVPSGTRKSVEGNIFLGALEYNVEAARLANKYPHLIRVGTWDQWIMAKMVFSLGRAGTDAVMANANGWRPLMPGNVYAGVRAWANSTGAMPVGRSAADKVAYRIAFMHDVTYAAAKLAGASSWASAPALPPSMPGTAYRVPRGVTFPQGLPIPLPLVLVAVGAGVVAFTRSR